MSDTVYRPGIALGSYPERPDSPRQPLEAMLQGALGRLRRPSPHGPKAGLRFVATTPDAPFSEAGEMDIVIGEALQPPSSAALGSIHSVRDWHASIMASIGVLCGKSLKRHAKEKLDESV